MEYVNRIFNSLHAGFQTRIDLHRRDSRGVGVIGNDERNIAANMLPPISHFVSSGDLTIDEAERLIAEYNSHMGTALRYNTLSDYLNGL